MPAAVNNITDFSVSSSVERARKEKEAANKGKVSHQDFLLLLTKQLTSQDPLNPMQDVDFTAQLAQLQALEEQIAMTKSMAAMRKDSQLQSASNMIGKYITGKDSYGNQAAGLVSRVVQSDGEVYLELANKQRVEVTEVVNLWSDSNTMFDQLAGSGGIIGKWVEAGIDPESKQPIRGIVEKVLVDEGSLKLKLYGGNVIGWEQVKELRVPTSEEAAYTLPDDVREKVEKAKKLIDKVVSGKDAAGNNISGIAVDAVLKGSSDVYIVLANGTEIKLDDITGEARNPTAADINKDLLNMWVKGYSKDSKEITGLIAKAEDKKDGILITLTNGKELYYDSIVEARKPTEKELEEDNK